MSHAWVLSCPGVSDHVPEWIYCGDAANATYVFHHDEDALRSATPQIFAEKLGLGAPDSKEKERIVAAIYTTCTDLPPAFAGYVSYDSESKNVVIAWRGTVLQQEWDVDANIFPAPYETKSKQKVAAFKGKEVHRGFLGLYNTAVVGSSPTDRNSSGGGFIDQVLSVLEKAKISVSEVNTFYITGHSLGGALATLTGIDAAAYSNLKINVITFSAPRALGFDLAYEAENHASLRGFNNVRLVVDLDMVPIVPGYVGGSLKDDDDSDLTKKSIVDITKEDKTKAMMSNFEFKVVLEPEVSPGSFPSTKSTASAAGKEESKTSEVKKEPSGPRISSKVIANLAWKGFHDLILNKEDVVVTYRHFGICISLSTVVLPKQFQDRDLWSFGEHHSLNAILAMLQPHNEDRHIRVGEDLTR